MTTMYANWPPMPPTTAPSFTPPTAPPKPTPPFGMAPRTKAPPVSKPVAGFAR